MSNTTWGSKSATAVQQSPPSSTKTQANSPQITHLFHKFDSETIINNVSLITFLLDSYLLVIYHIVNIYALIYARHRMAYFCMCYFPYCLGGIEVLVRERRFPWKQITANSILEKFFIYMDPYVSQCCCNAANFFEKGNDVWPRPLRLSLFLLSL